MDLQVHVERKAHELGRSLRGPERNISVSARHQTGIALYVLKEKQGPRIRPHTKSTAKRRKN